MAERILGLDIGDALIKAVVVTRLIRGGVQVEYCAARARGADEDLSAAVAALFAEHEALRNISCITTLPACNCSFRDLSFPFRDKKKIRQTLPLAIEPLLPFPMTEALVDYLLANAAGEAQVLAAAAARATVQSRIDLLKGQVRNIAALDVETVPLLAAFLSKQVLAGFDLLIDIGARHTVVLFVRDRCLIQIREYAFGAETEVGAEDGPQTTGPEEDACHAFCRELRNTVDFLRWRGFITENPFRIYLTGGGSANPYLNNVLSEFFSSPVERVDMAVTAGISFSEEAKRQWEPLVMNQALALAVRPFKKEAGFDFHKRRRREDLGYRPFKKNLPWLAAMAAVIVFLVGAEVVLDYYDAKLRLQQIKGQINALYRQYNPQATRIVDPIAQMRAQLAESKKTMLGMTDTAGGVTALDVLKDISSLVPPATEVLVTGMTMDRDAVVIKGEAKNFDAVQAVRNDLGKSKIIKTVAIGATNLMKQGEKVEFDLKVTLK